MKIFQREVQLLEFFLKFIESYSEPLVFFDPERIEIVYMNQAARSF